MVHPLPHHRSRVGPARPHGIKYAFTLHDIDGTRLLGFDNAHGIPRAHATTTAIGFAAPMNGLLTRFMARTN